MANIERKTNSKTLELDSRAVAAIERVADQLAALIALLQSGGVAIPTVSQQSSKSRDQLKEKEIEEEAEDAFERHGEDVIPNFGSGIVSGFGDEA